MFAGAKQQPEKCYTDNSSHQCAFSQSDFPYFLLHVCCSMDHNEIICLTDVLTSYFWGLIGARRLVITWLYVCYFDGKVDERVLRGNGDNIVLKTR